MEARLCHLASVDRYGGGISGVTGMLDQMIDLARQSANGNLSTEEMAALQEALDKLLEELGEEVSGAAAGGKLLYDKTDATDPEEVLQEANREMRRWTQERVKEQLAKEGGALGTEAARAREGALILEYSAKYRA